MANYLASGTFNGLGTFSFGVPAAGNFKIRGNISLPTIPEGESANSQVVVTIKINSGSTLYTGAAGDKGFEFSSAAAANDVFNVTLTSSASVDQGLNKIKLSMNLSEI